MDAYDIKVIRQEGEDTRKKVELLRNDIKESNKILTKILIELMGIQVNTESKSPYR